MAVTYTLPAAARFGDLVDKLFERLEEAFESGGWKVQRNVAGGPSGYVADCIFEDGRHRYVGEVRIAREARRPELPALLSDAYVRAAVGARAHAAKPLAIVGAPMISDALAAELTEHARRFFPDAAWGLLDAAGRFELHGEGLDGIHAPAVPMRIKRVAAPTPFDIFSDKSQWMSKVLLAPAIPPRYLNAPRELMKGPRELARVAHVSPPTASRYLTRMRQLGFLDSSGSLQIVQRERFLGDWRRAARFQGTERAARFLFRTSTPAEKLMAALQKFHDPAQASLALFAACERLGLGFVRGAPLHIYLHDASDAELERLGLVQALPGEGVDVYVREPSTPESIFRGAMIIDGVAVTDVLQCWLDVADHPVRGAEQAQEIWKRVIEPQLVGQRSE